MKENKILFVTHASFEQPGSMEKWAHAKGYTTQEVRPYMNEPLPSIDDFDFVIVMGGPQSPLERENAPYLNDEIKLVREAIDKGKRIIGVCLGAQLIGEALGATTERSPNREIGSYPLTLLDGAKDDPVFSQFPETFDVIHWHSDMPGIPADGVLLAKSKGCPRQAFRYSDRVYGFQCHFELTRELVENMIANCPDDLKTGPYVRSVKELVESDFVSINHKLDRVLDHLDSLPELK